jgi:hypothetical protein
LNEPINSFLQIALQNLEAKIVLRVTELKKFLEEKRKVETLNNLRASGPKPTTPTQFTEAQNDNRTASHK